MSGAPGTFAPASNRPRSRGPRNSDRLVTALALAALAALAAMLGFACGAAPSRTVAAPLAAAGTAHDDGSGVLAQASNAASLPGLLGGASYGRPHDHALHHAATYGGNLYGGNLYGGSLYGGSLYGAGLFDWSRYPWGAQPQPAHARGYLAGPVTQGGTIEGLVLWPSPPRAAPLLATGQPDCQGAVANDTLRVDEQGRVRGAVVYLEDIERGRYGVMEPSLRLQKMQLGGVLRQQQCRFVPHVQVVSPVGAVVRLVNDDSTTRTWTGTWQQRDPAFQTAISRVLPRRVALDGAGFVRVADDQTPASAWVVVAAHPYYTVTDQDGRFWLHDVPPGAYTLVVWHEPVARLNADGQIELTGAVTRKIRVRVAPDGRDTVTVKLPADR